MDRRTAIDVLYEHCSENGLPQPVFTTKEEKDKHGVYYSCTCSVEGLQPGDGGSSESEDAAKLSAASAFLLKNEIEWRWGSKTLLQAHLSLIRRRWDGFMLYKNLVSFNNSTPKIITIIT